MLVVFQFWKSVFQKRTDGVPFNAVGSIKMFGDLGCNVPGRSSSAAMVSISEGTSSVSGSYAQGQENSLLQWSVILWRA
jgi:hypothetical protein